MELVYIGPNTANVSKGKGSMRGRTTAAAFKL